MSDIDRSGNVDGKDIEPSSVSTDEAPGVADYVIKAGDDAQSIIEGASPGDRIAVESGATYDISPPFNPPRGIVVEAGGPDHHQQGGSAAIFRKAGDGDLAEFTDYQTWKRITFDGNKANYAGNTATNTNGANGLYFEQCEFINGALAGFEIDGLFWTVFNRCKFDDNGTWGHRYLNPASSDAESSQISFTGWCSLRGNGSGGVYCTDDTAHHLYYDPVIVFENSGPAWRWGGWQDNIKINANVLSNDGIPVVFEHSGLKRRLDIDIESYQNGSNVTSTSATNVGEVHFAGSGGVRAFTLAGRFSTPGAGINSVVAEESSSGKDVTMIGGVHVESGDYTYTLAGSGGLQAVATGVTTRLFDESMYTNVTGTYIDNGYQVDLETGTRFYGVYGQLTAAPHSANGSGDVYLDYSTNPPEWKVDDPTDSAWETM